MSSRFLISEGIVILPCFITFTVAKCFLAIATIHKMYKFYYYIHYNTYCVYVNIILGKIVDNLTYSGDFRRWWHDIVKRGQVCYNDTKRNSVWWDCGIFMDHCQEKQCLAISLHKYEVAKTGSSMSIVL